MMGTKAFGPQNKIGEAIVGKLWSGRFKKGLQHDSDRRDRVSGISSMRNRRYLPQILGGSCYTGKLRTRKSTREMHNQLETAPGLSPAVFESALIFLPGCPCSYRQCPWAYLQDVKTSNPLR